MQIVCIKETCIYVSDLEATRNFYEGLLGLPLISIAEGRHIFFRAGTSVLLCFIASRTMEEGSLPVHGAHGIIHFAFEVSKGSFESALAEVEAAGIPVLDLQAWHNGCRSFYFHDPDGNLVEVVEQGLWEKD